MYQPAVTVETVASPQTITLPKRIPELDGFRTLAVLMVMAEHVYDGWQLPMSSIAWMPRVGYFVLTHGWLGVDLFFILSGFLITGILLDERERPDYFRTFYGRRALRILPLAITCIAIWFLTYRHHGSYLLLALIFCANLDILIRVGEPHGPGVLWSLSVEEHFYLIWPLAVRRLKLRTLTILAASIVVLSPGFRWIAMELGARDQSVYQLSWFRFDGLAIGALLAIFVRSQFFTARNTLAMASAWLAVIGLVTVALHPLGVFQPKSALGEALRYTQAQALFVSAMAVALAYQGSMGCALLRSSFAQWTARLSYCLYLIHVSLGDLYYWMLRHAAIDDVAAFGAAGALLARGLVIFVVSFGVAALSQKFLEGPFMRLRKFFA